MIAPDHGAAATSGYRLRLQTRSGRSRRLAVEIEQMQTPGLTDVLLLLSTREPDSSRTSESNRASGNAFYLSPWPDRPEPLGIGAVRRAHEPARLRTGAARFDCSAARRRSPLARPRNTCKCEGGEMPRPRGRGRRQMQTVGSRAFALGGPFTETYLALIELGEGDPGGARTRLLRALVLHRELGDAEGEAVTLTMLKQVADTQDRGV
jgi:hypothetical protein